ncbi:MAG TPA: hypothetical protein VE153_34780 [Myxococcus sp.]|nr:hypothetical protein [Myxococcus sp.]
MTVTPDFDLDEALRTLDAASKKFPEGSPEERTVQLSALSLLYVLQLGKLREFREYLRERLDPSFQVQVSQVFASREDAEAWLASGKAADGERVKIAGQGFQVVRLPKGPRFLRAPLPDEPGAPEAE